MVSRVTRDTHLITEKNPNKKYFAIMEKIIFKKYFQNYVFEKISILKKSGFFQISHSTIFKIDIFRFFDFFVKIGIFQKNIFFGNVIFFENVFSS